jgi:hypothetical protein
VHAAVQGSLGVVGNAVADGAEVVELEEDAGLGAAAAAAAQEKQHGRRHSRERERQAHGHRCADDQLQPPALLRTGRHRTNGLGGRGGQRLMRGRENEAPACAGRSRW